jgi:nucleotide-binding universal stress UspA family protein
LGQGQKIHFVEEGQTMLKKILVAAAGSKQTDVALETAAAIAHPYSAHIECLRIHPDPTQALAAASSADMGSGLAIAELLQAMKDDDLRRTKKARQIFDEFCRRRAIEVAQRPGGYSKVTASWHETMGIETERVIDRAYFNDLTVLEHASGGGGFSPISAGSLLLRSGRPLLVAGLESLTKSPSIIAVAWKKTPEAARAMTAALPLFAKAERIVVVSVNEDLEKESESRLSLNMAVDYLRWHGLTVDGRLSNDPVNAAETMLGDVAASGAQLLVMGGYGHSRMRELIFGGFTRRVLKGINMPVFLSH